MLFCFVFYIMQNIVNNHHHDCESSPLNWQCFCSSSHFLFYFEKPCVSFPTMVPPTCDYLKCCTCVWFLQRVLRPRALLCWLIFVSTVLVLFWALSLRMFPVSLLVYVLLSCCLLIFFVLLLLYFLLFCGLFFFLDLQSSLVISCWPS